MITFKHDFQQRWTRVRVEGISHYAITRGLFGTGLPCFTAWLIHAFFVEKVLEHYNLYYFFGGFLAALAGSLIFGYYWGRKLWDKNERRFLSDTLGKLQKVNAPPAASHSDDFTAASAIDPPTDHRRSWTGIYTLFGGLILVSGITAATFLTATSQGLKSADSVPTPLLVVAPTSTTEPTSTPHHDEFTAAIHRADDWAFSQKLESDFNDLKQSGAAIPKPTPTVPIATTTVIQSAPTKLQIQYVTWAQTATGRWAIVFVGGRNPNGTLWRLREREAIDGHLSGKYAFSVDTKKGPAKVYPTAEYEDGSVALHVRGDTDEYFFLMQLPDFPNR